MSSDLRTLLQETAPRPRRSVDVDELFARVHRRRRTSRRAAGAMAVLAVTHRHPRA